jgi:hypothetical protein
LFALLSWLAPAESDVAVVLWSATMGALWGALFGLIGRRGMEGAHCDMTADGRLADDARKILSDPGLLPTYV